MRFFPEQGKCERRTGYHNLAKDAHYKNIAVRNIYLPNYICQIKVPNQNFYNAYLWTLTLFLFITMKNVTAKGKEIKWLPTVPLDLSQSGKVRGKT